MTIHIYDGMAVLRRALDTDPLGKGPRKVIMNMMAASPKDLHIWVFEGKGAKAMRRRLYPGYKERPSSMTDSFFAVVKMIREALMHTRAMQIDIDGFEGDDVIAALCKKYAGQQPIQVHSVDRDLHQLGVYPQVKVNVSAFKPAVPDQYVRLYKTYVGDPSDKIPGLVGFGPKSWDEIEPALLLEAHQRLVRNDLAIEAFMASGMKEATAARVCTKAQAELLRTFWIVVGFLPLEGDWISEMKVGSFNKLAAFAILDANRQ